MTARKIAWTVVALVGGYIFCQVLADIGATKLVRVWSVVIPGGTFVFAATFTLRDMVQKRLGRDWAIAVVISSGLLNLVMAGYLALIVRLPGVDPTSSAAFASTFAIVPAIVLGSIAAEVVSGLTDTVMYTLVVRRLGQRFQWARVLISNAVSLPIDSLVFGLLAFVLLPPLFGAQPLPLAVVPAIVGGQIVWKAIVTVVSIPGIYLVKNQPLFEPV